LLLIEMATAFFALSITAATLARAADCSYDREAMISLGQGSFDQDMKGGWRALFDRGCIAEAADLIRDYRRQHQPLAGSSQSTILYWHEGQARALLGDTSAAIALFDHTREMGTGVAAWNLYVDATIFFLRKDRQALVAARNGMAKLGASPNL